MAKGASKSSASSGTRKKHARKAAKDGPLTDVPNVPKEKKPKGKDKSKNKEPPRKKAYVPPVKPQAVQQDPIDALGLAQRLPAALLVVWRGLSKKDTVTKSKALEELRAGWIDRIPVPSNDDHDDNQHAEDDDLARLEALVVSIPVWVRPSIHNDAGVGSILKGWDSWRRCTMYLRSSCTHPAVCVPWRLPSTQTCSARNRCAHKCSSTSAKSRPRNRSSASSVAGAWPRATPNDSSRSLRSDAGTPRTSPSSPLPVRTRRRGGERRKGSSFWTPRRWRRFSPLCSARCSIRSLCMRT